MSKFPSIPSNPNFFAIQSEVLKYREENNIFQKSISNRDGAETFTIFDGPPFKNGTPHYGHVLQSTIKDTIPRFWTMKWKRVPRTRGRDCHGIYIEQKVQKALWLHTNHEIEKFGIENFIKECYRFTNEATGDRNRVVPNIWRRADMQNAYETMSNNYMESVRNIFKNIYDQGKIYKGKRVSMYSTKLNTAVGNFEVQADNSYAEVNDPAITVKFKVIWDKNNILTTIAENIYILARTTTPWTIPANIALVVNPEMDYVQIFDFEKWEKYILAKDLVVKYYKDETKYEIIKQYRWTDLVWISYEAPFDYYAASKLAEDPKSENNANIYNSHKVYAADYVTATDGTWIVHTAPEFGEEDFQTGKKYNLYQTEALDEEGKYTSEIYDMKWLYYREYKKDFDKDDAEWTNSGNQEVLRKLTEKWLLFRKESVTHTVPLCPRTQTPLIYKTQDSRFIDISSIKPQLLANNENINRVPGSVKYSRFAKSIETAPDRCISRTKYRATPMPVWIAKDLGWNTIDTKVMWSREDIYNLDQTGSKILDRKIWENWLYIYTDLDGKEFDFHRPYIDKIRGQDWDKKYIRTLEVLDPWMDSGSMPFAQLHYPFENKEAFAQGFPADFIGEGTGQIRCWFQMMHNISTLITGQNAYKNVIVTWTVQWNDGRKMSKSFGNYPDIKPTIEKFGADSIRMMLLNSQLMVWWDLAFSEEWLKEVLRKINLPLRNSYYFFTTYANIDNFAPTKHSILDFDWFEFTNDLDEWIISKLAILINTVNESMIAYDIQSAVKPIYIFMEDLTNRYIRRNRRRFRKSENDSDKMTGYDVLYVVLVELCKVLAPFMPFLPEYIYRNLTWSESVHLSDWTE